MTCSFEVPPFLLFNGPFVLKSPLLELKTPPPILISPSAVPLDSVPPIIGTSFLHVSMFFWFPALQNSLNFSLSLLRLPLCPAAPPTCLAISEPLFLPPVFLSGTFPGPWVMVLQFYDVAEFGNTPLSDARFEIPYFCFFFFGPHFSPSFSISEHCILFP